MTRFIIVGLPRSGTTYLMTLLNSHPDVYCSGEQFNPYAIVGIGDDIVTDRRALTARDRDPVKHFEGFFVANRAKAACVGFKYMIGHTAQILSHLKTAPDIRIIYLRRENRLAQAASYAKAIRTRIWTQSGDEEFSRSKLGISPQYYKQMIEEAQSQDALFELYARSLQNSVLQIEYEGMFEKGFGELLCNFLGIRTNCEMRSNLGKQGNNSIIDRFENRDEIEQYFRDLGHGSWLGEEIGRRRSRYEDPVLQLG